MPNNPQTDLPPELSYVLQLEAYFCGDRLTERVTVPGGVRLMFSNAAQATRPNVPNAGARRGEGTSSTMILRRGAAPAAPDHSEGWNI